MDSTFNLQMEQKESEATTDLSKCGLLTLDTVGGKETDVAGLQRIVMCELWQSSLWLRFPCQRRVVHLYEQKERVKICSDTTLHITKR